MQEKMRNVDSRKPPGRVHSTRREDLDAAIQAMLDYDGPYILDVLVEKHENCFPMIPSGKAHNEMLLPEMGVADAIDAGGAVLV